MDKKTAVALIGFGGPENMDEVRPFLDSVLSGIRIPKERYEAVVHHYEIIGGKSLYKEVTFRQKKAIERWLSEEGLSMDVLVGLRHTKPSFVDMFTELKKKRVQKVVAFILAPFRCYSSYEKYTEKVEAAKVEALAQSIEIVYTEAFFTNELFIASLVACAKATLSKIAPSALGRTQHIFCAHSIPLVMSQKSSYAEQFTECSFRVAQKLGIQDWKIAYQSRSGNPAEPWLEPDILDVLEETDKKRYDNVVLHSPGFLCDNVEVIYDLDYEARKKCEELGLSYHRVPTVADNALFIEMIGNLITEKAHVNF